MYDIVIIGAGVAGSSFAAALAVRGWNVLLVERQQLPHHRVCGEFLSPESQASLRVMGLHATVAALNPAPMTQAQIIARSGTRVRMPLPGIAWGVSRFALDMALTQAATDAGASVRTGTTVTGVDAAPDGYRVRMRSASGEITTVSSRAVVAACGRHPLPSLRPGAATPHNRPTYVGMKCHFAGLALPPEVQLYLFDGGYVGVCPIEDGRTNVCMLVRRDACDGGVLEMIATAARRNPALGRALANGQPVPDTVVAVAPVDTGQVATPWDRFARLGDAAVMIPPLCGDGMAMALRAAELCVPAAHAFLCGHHTMGEWQHEYSAAWHHAFDRPVRLGRRLQWLLGMPGVGAAVLGVGALIPPLATQLVRSTRGQRTTV